MLARLLRIVCGVMIGALLLATTLAAQQPAKKSAKGIDGIWEGTLKAGIQNLRLAFKITRNDDGSLAATLDSIDQGAKDLKFDTVTFKDGDLHLRMKAIQGTFDAKLSADGAELVGTWKQGGATFPLQLKRVEKATVLKRPQDPKKPFPYAEEDVTYENKAAGITIAGTLTLPKSAGPHPCVLLICGSGPHTRDEPLMGHKPFLVLADYLTRHGIAVLRVDKRGCGKSGGKYAEATSVDFADDVLAGVDYLKNRKEINPKQIGLIGHSEGGLIAPMAAARSKDVAFIVLLAGPGLTGEEILVMQGQLLLRAMGASDKTLASQKSLQQRLFAIMREEKDNAAAEKKALAIFAEEFAKLSDAEKKQAEAMKESAGMQAKILFTPWFRFFLTYDPRDALRKVQCPVLALNGEKDLQVPPKEDLPEIEKALKAAGNKDFTIKEFPKLNHLFQTCKIGSVAEYGQIEETMAPIVLETIANWIAKHAQPMPAPADKAK